MGNNLPQKEREDASSTGGLTNIDVDFLSNGFNVIVKIVMKL